MNATIGSDRRRLAGVLTAVVAVAGFCGLASSTAAAAGKCRPAGAETVIQSARIVVVKRRDGITQACFVPTRRVTRLDFPIKDLMLGDSITAEPHAVNDRYVAYKWMLEGRSEAKIRMRVLDARRGRVVTEGSVYTDSELDSAPVGGVIRELVLRRDGAIAWLSTLPAPATALELRYSLLGQPESTLAATSAALEPGSLAFSRRYLYWHDAGAPASVRLPA